MKNIDGLKKNELLELCEKYPREEWENLKVPELKEYLKGKVEKTEPVKFKEKTKPSDLDIKAPKKEKRINKVKRFRRV